MQPIQSAKLLMREMVTYGYWRPCIDLTVRLYIILVVLSFVPGLLGSLTEGELLTFKKFYLILVYVALRVTLFFVLPYFGLVYLRERNTQKRLESEDNETRVSRNVIARDYRKTSSLTIFYPDAFQDELSVCAYTGGDGATPKQRCTAHHLNAASIIARPHISDYNNTAKTARFFVPPEIDVTAIGKSAPYFTRVQAWIEVQIDYIVNGQARKNLDRVYAWNGAPCAFAQKPDVDHALKMTRNIIEAHRGGPIVLFGSGRGANVALEVYVRLAADKKNPVRGVVLEGLVTDPLILLSLTRAYRLQHPSELQHDPLQIIKSMPVKETTRFLVVNSQADTLVDTSSSFDCFAKLQEMARGRCYQVRLESATRGSYATHNDIDACVYEEAALQFYNLIDEDAVSDF